MIIEKEYSHCLRCGRKLKSIEAKRRGYGTICFNKQLCRTRQRLFDISKKGENKDGQGH